MWKGSQRSWSQEKDIGDGSELLSVSQTMGYKIKLGSCDQLQKSKIPRKCQSVPDLTHEPGGCGAGTGSCLLSSQCFVTMTSGPLGKSVRASCSPHPHPVSSLSLRPGARSSFVSICLYCLFFWRGGGGRTPLIGVLSPSRNA